MPDLGVPELLIVAVIVLLLFGPGKAADIGGSLGRSIREFRNASKEDGGAPAAATTASMPSAGADIIAPPADIAPRASTVVRGRFCTECGTAIAAESQKFCTGCGARIAEPVA